MDAVEADDTEELEVWEGVFDAVSEEVEVCVCVCVSVLELEDMREGLDVLEVVRDFVRVIVVLRVPVCELVDAGV